MEKSRVNRLNTRYDETVEIGPSRHDAPGGANQAEESPSSSYRAILALSKEYIEDLHLQVKEKQSAKLPNEDID